MNIGQLLTDALRVGGVDDVFGLPLDGVPVAEVSDLAVAELLALAHELVHRRTAFVHVGDGRLVRPLLHRDDVSVRLGSAEEICALSRALGSRPGPGSLQLDLDPRMPVDTTAWPLPPEPVGPELPTDSLIALIRDSERPMVLAGPGVVDRGVQADLHAFAAAASLGVLNTWGAKGLFDWRSRHHLATIGLQEGDFDLGGLPGSDLIIATGLDPHESPDRRWQVAPFAVVGPHTLGPLSESIGRPRRDIPEPPLRAGLAFVTQSGWTRTVAPLAPTRVTRQYALGLGSTGLVAADAGTAGYWVARTFSTTSAGSTVVPSTAVPGVAVAAVIVTRRVQPWRPALAVIDGQPDEVTLGLLEEASRMKIGVGVEAWDPDGSQLDAPAHAERLARLIVTPTQDVVTLSTDLDQMDQMVDVAGPIVAWTDR